MLNVDFRLSFEILLASELFGSSTYYVANSSLFATFARQKKQNFENRVFHSEPHHF